MIVAISTVKDTAANVTRFVARNLANGVDHLVVLTEDTGAEAEEVLDAHPAVTHVRTGAASGWWPDGRPDDLNLRQRLNANLVRVLLAPFAWAEWVLHVDGDEVALLDRAAVAAVPADQPVLRLPPWEAVSRESWPTGEPTHFKRPLERRELVLLRALGLVEKPNMKSYFHGHVRGKVGVRPGLDLRLGLHAVMRPDATVVKTAFTPGTVLLHYDSATAEEFVRKFSTMAGAGARPVYRHGRIPVVNAVRSLVTMDIDDEVRREYLLRLYRQTTVEDFDTLEDLGLLEEVHPDGGSHVPTAAPADGLAAFESLLGVARTHSRDTLDHRHPLGGTDVLRAALARTGVPEGPAGSLLDAVPGGRG